MHYGKTLAALTLSATVLAAPAQGRELKLADFQPSTHDYHEAVYKPFNEELSAATNGELTVRVYSGGELGPGPAEQYNRAVDGVADMTFGLPGYTASNFPMTLLTELPGIVEPDTATQKVMDNLDFLSREYRRVALVGLWTNAPNVLFMANKSVRSPDDLKGLNIRVPSRNAGLVIEAWGATPVSMPAPEIYNAMQTGVIDGAFIDGTTLGTFRLSEVTKSITVGMDLSISSFFLLMNRDSFRDLSDDEQAAILEAGRAAAFRANEVQVTRAAERIEAFATTEGKEVIELTPEEAAKFNDLAAPVTAKVIAEVDAAGNDASGFVAALKGE